MASETTDVAAPEAVKYLPELRDFVVRGHTSVEWRMGQLRLLRQVLEEEKEAMLQALGSDLCVDEAQALLFQIGCLFGEIDHFLDNIASWSAMKKVSTPIVLQPASSYVQAQPKGVVLIIGAWNYPFVVTLGPMITALAAGNCVLLKPSELSPESAQVMHRICTRLDQRAVRCCLGGVELSTTLVAQPFDHIIYTGSTRVGRLIMAAAAPNLTPLTLELGGKSPVVICGGIDINEACRRIAVGKFVNCGQTCIAPDYMLVERGVRDEVVACLKKVITEMFGDSAQAPEKLSRMVNQQAMERLHKALREPHGGLVELGGASPPPGTIKEGQRYVQPTIVVDPKADSTIMQEELFGPVLPILSVASCDEAVSFINSRPKPLALYVFAPQPVVDHVMQSTSSGAILVGDTAVHKGNPNVPFGGIGGSGMGSCYGEFGFNELSHQRAVMYRPLFPPSPISLPADSALSKILWFWVTMKPEHTKLMKRVGVLILGLLLLLITGKLRQRPLASMANADDTQARAESPAGSAPNTDRMMSRPPRGPGPMMPGPGLNVETDFEDTLKSNASFASDSPSNRRTWASSSQIHSSTSEMSSILLGSFLSWPVAFWIKLARGLPLFTCTGEAPDLGLPGCCLHGVEVQAWPSQHCCSLLPLGHRDLFDLMLTRTSKWPWKRRLTVDEAAIERWRRDGGDLPTSSSALLEAPGNASAAPPLPPAWSKRLTFLRALGSGGHGTAYLYVASCGSSNMTVTVKLLHNKRLQDMREVRVMRAMYGVSDFCISTLGAPDYIDTESGLWIMMPFLNSGSLLQLLDKLENCPAKCRCGGRICWERLGAPYSIPYVQALLYQAALGVGALHSQGYHHMDLKPENIMLNCQGTNCFAEVIDLGIACHPKLCKWSGTIGFIAPEVWTGTGLGLAANDVWSLGVVFYEIMYGRKPPFHGDRNGRETRSYIPLIDDAIPKPGQPIDRLIENMLSHNPSRRPTIRGLQDWLRRIILNANPGQHVLDMIYMSPLERGAQEKVPPCLLQYEDPEYAMDIGDRPAHRMDCASPPRYAQGYFRCGVCVSCNPCCKCNVKRKDKLEKAYFRMSICE
eukprot:s1342_g6.t1